MIVILYLSLNKLVFLTVFLKTNILIFDATIVSDQYGLIVRRPLWSIVDNNQCFVDQLNSCKKKLLVIVSISGKCPNTWKGIINTSIIHHPFLRLRTWRYISMTCYAIKNFDISVRFIIFYSYFFHGMDDGIIFRNVSHLMFSLQLLS